MFREYEYVIIRVVYRRENIVRRARYSVYGTTGVIRKCVYTYNILLQYIAYDHEPNMVSPEDAMLKILDKICKS